MESAAIARSAGERKLEMDAVGSLANVALIRSDYPRAAELMSRSKRSAGSSGTRTLLR